MPTTPLRPRPAATIILMRPSAEGFEVFLVQRNRRSGFLPNAWVFPGGAVDPADAVHPHPRVVATEQWGSDLGASRADLVSFGVAGVRETFEEAGIWLGDGAPPEALRGRLARGELSLRELLETCAASVRLDALHPWSWWVTPEAEPKRYDTRFFAAVVHGGEGTHDQRETVDSGWFHPARILEDYRIDRFPLAPPTWWTLRELAGHARVEDVLAASPWNAGVPIQPIVDFSTGALRLLFPGHEAHFAAPVPGLPKLVRLERGTWVAEH